MKKPKTPPNYWKLFEQFKENFIGIIGKVISPLYEGSYIHWDDLIRKKLNSELTNEEYWFGLKFHRSAQKRKISLVDKDNMPFSFLLTDNILKDLHTIDLHTAGNIESFFPSLLNSENKERYLISSLIEEAITSSQIEGAITTRKVAKEMLRSGRKPRDVSEKMILNNYLTMKRIVEIKNEKLTPELVLEIHELITNDTLEDSSASGRLRNSKELIEVGDEVSGETYHVPPNAVELEDRLKLMCKFANNELETSFMHPVIRAIILHFWLAFDHPFVDGNGRTARALFYWCMVNNRYWLFEYISISQAIKDSKIKYYKSFLHSESDENDLTYFINYHLETINKSISSLGKYLERKSSEMMQFESEMKFLRKFNYRQKALLTNALKHPSQSYSFQSHAASHGVARQTARNDILELESKGLLVVSDVERRRIFMPVQKLYEKLKNLSEII
jgi:Fic family protein